MRYFKVARQFPEKNTETLLLSRASQSHIESHSKLFAAGPLPLPAACGMFADEIKIREGFDQRHYSPARCGEKGQRNMMSEMETGKHIGTIILNFFVSNSSFMIRPRYISTRITIVV